MTHTSHTYLPLRTVSLITAAVMTPQVGGWLLASGLGVNSNFLAFGLAAAVAGALLLTFPRAQREPPTDSVHSLETEGAVNA